jgi:hypothetical protein
VFRREGTWQTGIVKLQVFKCHLLGADMLLRCCSACARAPLPAAANTSPPCNVLTQLLCSQLHSLRHEGRYELFQKRSIPLRTPLASSRQITTMPQVPASAKQGHAHFAAVDGKNCVVAPLLIDAMSVHHSLLQLQWHQVYGAVWNGITSAVVRSRTCLHEYNAH